MESLDIMIIALFIIGILLLFTLFVTVKQGTIAVVTIFGK